MLLGCSTILNLPCSYTFSIFIFIAAVAVVDVDALLFFIFLNLEKFYVPHGL